MTTATPVNPVQKSKLFVNVDYVLSPVNTTIGESAEHELYRETTQLFHTISGQSFVFHTMNGQDGDIDFVKGTEKLSEFGCFEVDSDNFEDAKMELNMQLNELTLANKYLLFYDYKENPYLMEIKDIKFNIDDFLRHDEIDFF